MFQITRVAEHKGQIIMVLNQAILSEAQSAASPVAQTAADTAAWFEERDALLYVFSA